HLPDLAVAFAERAFELTRPGGVVALLIPAKLATSGYAEPLRRRLSHSARIERASPLPEPVARSFGAAVYPMALVAARADPTGMELAATALGPKPAAPSVSQRQLQRDGPWILAPAAERVSRRVRAQFPTVGDHWRPQIGVKTGADDLFLLAHRPGPPRRLSCARRLPPLHRPRGAWLAGTGPWGGLGRARPPRPVLRAR